MTPERLQEIRDLTDRRVKLVAELGTTPYPTLQCNIDLLAHVEAQDAEIAALRRGQGAAPKPATPGTTPYHVTHPIPDTTIKEN